MAKYEKTMLEVNGQKIPVKIYREFRSSVRASIGKKAAVLRLPALLPKKMQQERIAWFNDWVKKQVEKNDTLQQRFEEKSYQDGQKLVVGARTYQLAIRKEDRRTHSARLRNGIIYLKLGQGDEGASLQKNIQSLLSRTIAQDFLPAIERRVDSINDQFFQQNIRGVKLKHTHSRWGSCSTTGNINLSTRLLFAPDDVIDYVIIHELAHLLEFNHSKRFWKIIEDIMPDYKEKEEWLKKNGGKCSF